jgi:hypothetical protein
LRLAKATRTKETPDEAYLVPPIVRDTDGQVVMGADVLVAVVRSGVTIEHPVIEDCTPEQLAELQQRLDRVSEIPGVPFR